MAIVCINCYEQIHNECRHFKLVKKDIQSLDPCKFSKNPGENVYYDVTCCCGKISELEFTSGYKTYICPCGNFMTYSRWQETLGINKIHELTKIPFPSNRCPICDGSGNRIIHKFIRCSNCEGTGGIKPTNVCVICKGTGAIINDSLTIECNHVKY